MSHDATNWAIKQRGLKPAAKVVLWHLCDRYNPDYGCFPSQKTLAHDCEMSERSVRDQLATLEKAGLIRKEHRKSRHGTFDSDRYLLAFEEGFDQRQNLPAAKSANGKNACEPAANSRIHQRQNLPPNPVRVTNNKTSKIEFDAFWDIWPNKVSKAAALKAWRKLSLDDRRTVLAETPDWFRRWRLANPQASPIHAATFLNNRRWEDESAANSQQTPDAVERIAKYNQIGAR